VEKSLIFPEGRGRKTFGFSGRWGMVDGREVMVWKYYENEIDILFLQFIKC
jgi:hypothetical protein